MYRRFAMRLRSGILFILLTVVCPCLSSGQQSVGTANLTFTTIDVPGSMTTNVLGINNTGQLIDYYYDSGNGATSTGFLLSGGNFTYFNYPRRGRYGGHRDQRFRFDFGNRLLCPEHSIRRLHVQRGDVRKNL